MGGRPSVNSNNRKHVTRGREGQLEDYGARQGGNGVMVVAVMVGREVKEEKIGWMVDTANWGDNGEFT